MRYILSVFVIVSVLFFGLQLVAPVGATTSTTISAEQSARALQMKKSILERKIRVMKSELKKTAAAIVLAEKRIADLKAKNKNVKLLETRLATLKEKQLTQESNLAKLIAELAKLK